MLEQIFLVAIPGLVGALTTGVPLFIQLRRAMTEIRANVKIAELDSTRKAQELARDGKIDTEAEWKRVLTEKDTELIRLRAKDDEQEAKLGDLLTRHIECKQNEARQDERAKFFEKRSDEQSREIKALTSKLVLLDKLIREKLNASDPGSGSEAGGNLPVVPANA